MHIYGVDFTSAPNPRKPITVISSTLEKRVLVVEHCQVLLDFTAFEAFLHLTPPWLAACDFPFGLPRVLLTNLGWPIEWSAYMHLIARLDKKTFEQTLTNYQLARRVGDKHHLRVTDKLASACSPMMLYRVPVAKMFFQGATRLLESGVSVPPLFHGADERVVLEGYPALVARTFIGRQSYKSDERARQTPERLLARERLLNALCSSALVAEYGITLELPHNLRSRLSSDPTGDFLDALLCSIQAAWAFQQPGYGIPAECDRAEGWIVDPHIALSKHI